MLNQKLQVLVIRFAFTAETGVLFFYIDICSTKKTAFNRACEKAFSQLALVLLPQGKLAAVLVLTS